MTARFQSMLRKIAFVVCYDPTEDTEPDAKDEFYDQLESACPKFDIKIVLGDVEASEHPEPGLGDSIRAVQGLGAGSEVNGELEK